MIGPVLYLEMLLGGRRGKQFVFRWIYAGWLLLAFCFSYFTYLLTVSFAARRGIPTNLTSQQAESFVTFLLHQHFILVFLLAPAFMAGAVTDEKTRGTLQYMLTADLTGWEIVLGKLLGRMYQVVVLLLPGLPLICALGVFAGLYPAALLIVLAGTAAPLFAVGAACMLASVWSRQTRDAVLGLYATGALGFVILWGVQAILAWVGPPALAPLGLLISGFLTALNPESLLGPALTAAPFDELLAGFGRFTLAWGSIGAVCLVISALRLRAAYLKELENSGKKRREAAAVRRPAVPEDPVKWKERYVHGIAPLNFLARIPRWVGIPGVLLVTIACSTFIVWSSLPPVAFPELLDRIRHLDAVWVADNVMQAQAGTGFFTLGTVAMFLFSLVVGIRCSGSVSGERERQTWEALLLTPLETRQLIRGKLWGIIGACMPYVAAYAVPALLMSVLAGLSALFWMVLSLLVTALAMYYVGGAGIWCSVRSQSSWRSLLGTLGWGYVGAFVLLAISSPIGLAIFIVLLIFLALLAQLNPGLAMTLAGTFSTAWFAAFVSVYVILAVCFFAAARYFVSSAIKRVANRERIRHWKDEPAYRPQRRPTAERAVPY